MRYVAQASPFQTSSLVVIGHIVFDGNNPVFGNISSILVWFFVESKPAHLFTRRTDPTLLLPFLLDVTLAVVEYYSSVGDRRSNSLRGKLSAFDLQISQMYAARARMCMHAHTCACMCSQC